MQKEQSRRIQTSVLNAEEKKVLVWLASFGFIQPFGKCRFSWSV